MGDGEQLLRLLGAGSRFRDLRWLEVTDSTNRVVLEQARAGREEGLVVLADSQTAGRGRLDRRWQAAPGTALLLSALLRPTDLQPERRHLVTAAAGLALRQACTELGATEPEPELKWPNDLLYQGRKLAGILAEAEGDAVVVGIGCNVSAAPLGAASLEEATRQHVDRAALAAALLAALERRLGRWDDVAAEHRRCCGTVGRRVRIDTARGSVSGRAEGVDDAGRLLVRSEAGLLAFSAGDVVHLRPEGFGPEG